VPTAHLVCASAAPALLRSGIGSVGVIARDAAACWRRPFFISARFHSRKSGSFRDGSSIASGWRLLKAWKMGWAISLGCGHWLMIATKETVVLTLAAAGVAFADHGWMEKASRRSRKDHPRPGRVTAW